MAWIKIEDRLPEVDLENNWRTAKAYPVQSLSVGLTYAYLTRQGWVESHRFGNAEGVMADTDGSDHDVMLDVVRWYDIPEPPQEID